MSRYAAETEVSSERSRAEIEKILTRYGATAFGYGWQGTRALITFEAHGRRIKFNLPLPDRTSNEVVKTATGQARNPKNIESAYEQLVRSRWRALALCIKAKLEAVETGITEFESEFLAHIILPGGDTVGETIKPQLETAYKSGRVQQLLPHYGKE